MSKRARIYIALSMAAISSVLITNTPKVYAAENTIIGERQVSVDKEEAVKNINSGSKELSDYKAIGLTKVDSENIDIVCEAISNKKNSKGSDLTKNEICDEVTKTIKEIKTTLEKITTYEATLDDYKFIQVNSVTAENILYFNGYLEGKVRKISIIREKADRYAEAIDEVNAGTDELKYYNLITKNIDESNLLIMKAIVSEKKAECNRNLTAEEIENCRYEAEIVAELLENINNEEAKLADYEDADLQGVYEDSISDLNKVLKEKDLKTLKQVQNAINDFNTAVKNINEGKETLNNSKVGNKR